MIPHALRPAEPNDLGVVIHPWLQEMRLSPASFGIPNRTFFACQRRLILSILRGAETTIACDAERPNHVFGYVIHGPDFESSPVIHWLYVKSTYREMGLGRTLLEHSLGGRYPAWCSQASRHSLSLRAEKELRRYALTYNPFLNIPGAMR